MKVLVLLSLVAVCASIPTFSGKHVIVGEDGTITLRNTRGYSMDIMKSLMDPTQVDIILRNPFKSVVYHLDDTTHSLPSEVTLRNIFGYKYPSFNRADILLDTFRHYEGVLDEETYNRLLSRIQFLIEAGVLPEALLDILRTWEFEHPVNGIRTEDLLDKWYPVQKLQTLLQQIKDKRQFQQGLLNGEHYPNEYIFQKWTPEYIFGQKEDVYPMRDTLDKHFNTLYDRAFAYMKKGYEQENSLDQVAFEKRLLQWSDAQELINHRVDQFVEQRTYSSEKLRNEQRFINQETEELIKQLVYKHALIIRQIEQMVKQKQMVSQEVVAEQRFVYQQVHEMLEKLVYQQMFVNGKIQKIISSGNTPEPEFFIQQRIIYQQVQQLIQQLFMQQVYLRQQIQFFVQERDFFPQELVSFQEMTYQQVDKFIHVLIKQLFYQQNYFKQLIQLFVQQKQTIPHEIVSEYTTVYEELLQLVRHVDFVPQNLIDEQQRTHEEILHFLEQEHAGFLDYFYQRIPQQYPYQRVPQQWVSGQEHNMYMYQPEYFQPREMMAY